MKGLGQGAAKHLPPSHRKRLERVAERDAETVLREDGTPLSRSERMDLGLVLLQRRAKYGEPLTADEQADWGACTHQAMDRIFHRTLEKLRALATEGDPRLRELFDLLFPREREAAKPHRTRTYL